MKIIPLIQKMFFYLLVVIPSLGVTLLKKLLRRKATVFNDRKNVKKIVVFQLGHLGDMVHTIPLLRNLKTNFESASITVVGGEWNSLLAKEIPYINHYLVFNNWVCDRREGRSFFRFIISFFKVSSKLNRERFDIGIDLRGHIHSLYLLYISNIRKTVGFTYKWHGCFLNDYLPLDEISYEKDLLLTLLPLCNCKIIDSHFEFPISEKARQTAYKRLKSITINTAQPVVAIYPGGSFAPRRWPEKKFAALADKIIEEQIGTILFLGGKKDCDSIVKVKSLMKLQAIDWIGNDLQIMAALIERSNLFVGNDSGPMHIAVALNIPTIAFFSSANYKRWGPKTPHIILRSDVSCSPCDLESDICNKPKVHCLDLVSLDEALSAVKSLINDIS